MSVTASEIIDIVRRRGRGDPPAALADVFVNPLVKVGTFLDAKINFARDEQVIDEITSLLVDDETLSVVAIQLEETLATLQTQLRTKLEEIGSNFGIVRRPGLSSRGSVLLLKSSTLTSTITVPVGTRLFASSISQEYKVTETTIISSMTYDATLQRFIASIPVESMNIGTDTIAAPNQVTLLKTVIVGIDGVTNPASIIGGRNIESDLALADRIKSSLSANNIGTKSGYKNLVLAVPEVKDALIVGAADPFMVRDQGDGGSVDIYVTDPIPYIVSEQMTADNTVFIGGTTYRFTPGRQPIINDIAAVIFPLSLTVTAASITKDVGPFAGSSQAVDFVFFDATPAPFGEFIQYQTNNLVLQIQTYMNDDARKILGSDVLVKEAVISLVNITMTVKLLPGFANSRSIVRDRIEAAVAQFVASLNIGVNLEQSDIVNLVVDVPGVDRVNLPIDIFDKSPNLGQQNVIAAVANEVLRLNNVDVNFV